ncbi:MAG: taurine ABC transporter substrate-binding protein, partial [Deltaproteobacteria bacterium]|nr:taurine ABC transporter substrate-binding protein [Deltaproteobacteria bacterium]
KQPGTARAFLEAYFESIEKLKRAPRECALQLLGLTGLSLDQQLAVLKDITWHGLDKQHEMMKTPGMFVEGLQKLGDFLVTHRQIDRAPEVGKWVNTGLLP